MRVYFDNAATTPLDPEVFSAMEPFFKDHYGNPSSIHSHGREVRSAIEKARKTVAEILNATPGEIFFTSGGTEADNTIINCSIEAYGIKHAITSPIEHHAVLHSMEHIEKMGHAQVHYVSLTEEGHIDYDHLESLLSEYPGALVSLMNANNEIGNITDIEQVGNLCEEHNAYFHSDTVQTMGHFNHDLKELNIHSLVGSAHKFHGPKGVGFMYVKKDHKVGPFIQGGAQERNMRGGTENVYGIIGLAKALEIAAGRMQEHRTHIEGIKSRMIDKLSSSIEDIAFNGDSSNLDRSLYTVLNVCLPESNDNDMLLFNLDMNHISASGGSACSSGSNVGSHVLEALKTNPNRGAIRFSFSRYNQPEEVDYVVEKLAEFYKVEV